MVALGITACNKQGVLEKNEAKVYQVCIPASMNGGADSKAVSIDGTTSNSTFLSTEKVYVYNQTKDEVMGGYLQPTGISADGKGCDLTGTLTGTSSISANDVLVLMLNLSHASTNKTNDTHKTYTSFKYDNQNGTQAGVVDGAMATVTVSNYAGGVLTTTENAKFRNVQSIFRVKFSDKDGSAINVKTLIIRSNNPSLATQYAPLSSDYPYSGGYILVNLPQATTDFIYVAICFKEHESNSSDALTFTATDNSGNEYMGTKTAPSGGFKNGKYYYNSSAIQLAKQPALVKPTITWTSVAEAVEPDSDHSYFVRGTYYEDPQRGGCNNNDIDITLSGTSKGYYFSLGDGGTVRFNNFTAKNIPDYQDFIYASSDLTIDITGANSIICASGRDQCICTEGALKLSGNGTLTVTSTVANRYGLYSSINYYNFKYDYEHQAELPANNSDPGVLAAIGYTVTRSTGTNNGDGTYTWTYTVTPTL